MMADTLSPELRSWNMSRIAGRNTRPEVTLRSHLHRAGLRFRLHDRTLPGKPDIVLKRYKTVIFVHGCFWHRHAGCNNATMPSSNTEFWSDKFRETVDRDERKARELRLLGWNVLTVWECDIAKRPKAVLSCIENQIHGVC
jgi:DNA mismatch endonuclease (patch repair protein)